jgi:hypothetical protein
MYIIGFQLIIMEEYIYIKHGERRGYIIVFTINVGYLKLALIT